MDAKRIAQAIVRWGNKTLFTHSLPDRLAIYFHEIELAAYPQLREMVSYFRDLGYGFTGDPNQFVDRSSGVDRKMVFLSIDDNFRTTLELAELCDELDVRFAVYLNTICFRGDERCTNDALDLYYSNLQCGARREILSTDEIIELSHGGHTIGAHGHSHRCLTKLAEQDAKEEILTSKEILGELLGYDIDHFAYPFGMRRHFSEALRDYCQSIGFTTVANAIPAMQHAEQSKLAIQRSGWDLNASLQHNLENLQIDGRWFERLTGRSAVGR